MRRLSAPLSARSIHAASAVLWLVVGLPGAAWACPVCGVGTGSNEWAYSTMSAVLSVLPLGMIFGGSFWLYRRVRQHERSAGERAATDRPDPRSGGE